MKCAGVGVFSACCDSAWVSSVDTKRRPFNQSSFLGTRRNGRGPGQKSRQGGEQLSCYFLDMSTFRTMCTVPIVVIFGRVLISYFPSMFFRYLLNAFEMVPVAPFITGVTFAFLFPHVLIFCFELFVFQNLLGFFLRHFLPLQLLLLLL